MLNWYRGDLLKSVCDLGPNMVQASSSEVHVGLFKRNTEMKGFLKGYCNFTQFGFLRLVHWMFARTDIVNAQHQNPVYTLFACQVPPVLQRTFDLQCTRVVPLQIPICPHIMLPAFGYEESHWRVPVFRSVGTIRKRIIRLCRKDVVDVCLPWHVFTVELRNVSQQVGTNQF